MGARVTTAVALVVLSAGVCGMAQDAPAPPTRTQKPLVARGTVTGAIYCADTNAPARLAQVTLVPANGDPSHSSPFQMTVQTDLDGRFAIGRVPEGKYYVSVELAGYLNPAPRADGRVLKPAKDEDQPKANDKAPAVVVSSSAKQEAAISIGLERAGEMDGTVLYDDGSPAIGLHVSLQPKPEKPGQAAGQSAEESFGDIFRGTDDHGHFRILGVAPGEYLINVQVPASGGNHPDNSPFVQMVAGSDIGSLFVFFGDTTRASKTKAIKVGRGEVVGGVDITIPLGKLHTVHGTVVLKSNGEPPPSAAVVLLYADTREMARAALAVDGQFEFAYLPEDDYILQASASSVSVPADLEDSEGMGFMISGSRFDGPGPMNTEAGAEIPFQVRGDVNDLTIAVPDPPTEPAPAPAAGPQVPASTPQ